MSFMPSASNKLSPLPRIHSGEAPSNATAVDQRRIDSRLRRSSSLRAGNPVTSTKLRSRASSDAGALAANPQVRNRSGSTSFGSTQGYEDVHELLKLRKQRLKEAYRKGDEIELQRLKNLNLFDDIERPQPKNELKEAAVRVDLTEQSDHYGFTLPTNSLDSDFIPRPKSVNQGHTATLCWHLKLEHTQGLVVPKEFAHCRVHPTPSLGASSDSSSTPQPASPDSISSAPISSLSHMKISSIGSSQVRDSSEPSSPATTMSKGISSKTTLSTKASSLGLNPHEEDPFLYIAKYISRHAKRDGRFKEVKDPASQAPNADVKRLTHIQCTCANHSCRTYLSGAPSKHCRNCRLPRLQPEIIAAVKRIEQMKISAVSAQAVPDQVSEADEFREFEALQEDMRLVEMFYAETEKRCRNGVWWEGWLIVQNLKRQGVVGSQPYVYAGDKALAA